ncbi:MAG TPA: response regulator transcription factor [Brumimicrobium sp.]|nr:response regulator transcription factor [Brumimicrobium sp.]
MAKTSGKILLIEDEKSLSEVVQLNLQMDGFEVTTIDNGRVAVDYASNVAEYDLVILDVMLPEVSGWSICDVYKKHSPTTPILFLSAKGSTSDRIHGLKLGADDFLPKPFDLEELLLRVQILIQRKQGASNKTNLLTIGELEVNLTTYEVRKGDEMVVELTKREIELLQLFHEKEGEVVSREYILNQLWGKDSSTTTRTIDNYILSYRKLFEKNAKDPEYFHSIRGVGYKFTNN